MCMLIDNLQQAPATLLPRQQRWACGAAVGSATRPSLRKNLWRPSLQTCPSPIPVSVAGELTLGAAALDENCHPHPQLIASQDEVERVSYIHVCG